MTHMINLVVQIEVQDLLQGGILLKIFLSILDVRTMCLSSLLSRVKHLI